MEKVKVTMTVLFEEPFWIGIYEREDGESYQATKILFGAEPKGMEVQEYLLKNVYRLSFGTGKTSRLSDRQTRKNPKRMQREIRKQTREGGTGTRAQQAIQAQREERKIQKRIIRKEDKLAEEKERFLQKQQKKREKHRGH